MIVTRHYNPLHNRDMTNWLSTSALYHRVVASFLRFPLCRDPVLIAQTLLAILSQRHMTNPAHTIISEDLNPCLRLEGEENLPSGIAASVLFMAFVIRYCFRKGHSDVW